MKNNQPFIVCNYEEFKAETFKGFSIRLQSGVTVQITEANPHKAWMKTIEYLKDNKYRLSDVMLSSTIDHFISDTQDRQLAVMIYGEKNVNPKFGKAD